MTNEEAADVESLIVGLLSQRAVLAEPVNAIDRKIDSLRGQLRRWQNAHRARLDHEQIERLRATFRSALRASVTRLKDEGLKWPRSSGDDWFAGWNEPVEFQLLWSVLDISRWTSAEDVDAEAVYLAMRQVVIKLADINASRAELEMSPL